MKRAWFICLIVLSWPLTGCLHRGRAFQQAKTPGPIARPDLIELVDGINRRYEQMRSFTAAMEIRVSATGRRRHIDYTSCPGYILFRKPQMLRVLILVPLLHTRAVDLASDGTSFTLLIPSRNRVVEGENSVTTPAANPLENLRPDVFLNSILIHSIAPDQIISFADQSVAGPGDRSRQSAGATEYDLTVFTEAHTTRSPALMRIVRPLRIIRFGGPDLLPVEQDIFNAHGDLETQVLYGPYRNFGGVEFPSTFEINRPLDEYRIRLAVSRFRVNQPLTDDQFRLKIPEGVRVQKLR